MSALRTRRRGGFTLLEVMVAVTILGIALVAIFASEGGAIRNGARARRMTTATLLARCKMGEIEETAAREGLPAVSSSGVDGCCEDGEVDGFECEWEIERIVLPDEIMMGGGGGEEGEGALSGLLGGGDDDDDDEHGSEGAGGVGGLAAAAAAGGAGGLNLSSPPSPAALMSGAMGGGDMVSSLALQIAFPILKPAIEEQVRRATVTVRWHEGDHTEELRVVQFLVAEQPAAALTNAAADALTGAVPGGAVPGGAVPGGAAPGGNPISPIPRTR